MDNENLTPQPDGPELVRYPEPEILETNNVHILQSLLMSGFSVAIPPISDAVSGDKGELIVSSQSGGFQQRFVVNNPQAPIHLVCEPDNTRRLVGLGYIEYELITGSAGKSEQRECIFHGPNEVGGSTLQSASLKY